MTTSAKKSPFHRGELQVQKRYGVDKQMGTWGRKVIRDYMPDQHRDFYEQLPFVVTGGLDAQDRPWASILFGQPGFIQSPDARTLTMQTAPVAGDPLAERYRDDQPVGVLGIELHTRRRNRMNGRVQQTKDGLCLTVDQAFGNCPKYIQARAFEYDAALSQPTAGAVRDTFDDKARALITAADTFFIASAHRVAADDDQVDPAASGVDASHRGGLPGFVSILDARRFSFPDYSGNNHYNTIGNLVVDPRSGYLFPNFETGDLLYLTGTTKVHFEPGEVTFAPGAERMLVFELEAAVLIEKALPFRWTYLETSPFVHFAEKPKDGSMQLTVARIVQESARIRSFYLVNESGDLPRFKPGQFLTVILEGSTGKKMVRNYSLSNSSGGNFYRISVKREGAPKDRPDVAPGRVSNYLHDHVRVGDKLRVRPPSGDFTLDDGDLPVVLISAGVGITPMLSMAHHIQENTPGRDITFIHGARDGSAFAFAEELNMMRRRSPRFNRYISFSQPLAADNPGDYQGRGRITSELVARLVGSGEKMFYLCGPTPFMDALRAGLREQGVAETHLHFEAFGPGAPSDATQAEPLGDASVTFQKAGKTVNWTAASGSLLDLAEDNGLEPPFSCRTGSCHACIHKIVAGQVQYDTDLPRRPEDGYALLCQAKPKGPVVLEV